MYLSVLEQFEIVLFLAFVNQTYSICMMSFIVIGCITYIILFYLSPFRVYYPEGLSVVGTPKVLSSGVMYADLPPEYGKERKIIIVPVEITDQMSSDLHLGKITSAYTNHPWYVEGRFHFVYGIAIYLSDKSLLGKKKDLSPYFAAQRVGSTFAYPPSVIWQKDKVYSFFKNGLDDFDKRHKSEPYQICFILISLIQS